MYVIMVMVMTVISILISVVVLDLHWHEPSSPVPKWLRRLAFGFMVRTISLQTQKERVRERGERHRQTLIERRETEKDRLRERERERKREREKEREKDRRAPTHLVAVDVNSIGEQLCHGHVIMLDARGLVLASMALAHTRAVRAKSPHEHPVLEVGDAFLSAQLARVEFTLRCIFHCHGATKAGDFIMQISAHTRASNPL